MSEPSPTPNPTGFESIEAALSTALAVLTDPVAPARGALPHLIEVRDGLLELSSQDPEIAARVAKLDLESPADEALFTASETLSAEIRALKVRLRPEVAARARLFRKLRRTALVLAVLVVGAIVALIWVRDRTPGPWHGKYFQNMDFKPPLRVRRDKNINFNWGSGIPLRALPTDRFSVRWDTCLEISHETMPTFQLTADDGARLFVDGHRIIDIWNAPRGDTQSGSALLAPGSHHLRVDYYENKGRARVSLQVSFDGEKPHSIPRDMLRYPGNRFKTKDLCGDGTAEESGERATPEPEHEAPSADEAIAPPSDEDDSAAPDDN